MPRQKTDDDRREAIRNVFGKNYVGLILNPEQANYNQLVDHTKEFVERRARNISTSQLRNIFSKVKTQQEPMDLYKLRPQLAYVAGRADNEQMKELVVLLDDLIKEVDEETLTNFKDFFESIIAYHKYFNPKGN